MAKEMILVPKVKYEHLLQKLEPVDTSSRENDHQSSRQTPENQVQSDSDLIKKLICYKLEQVMSPRR